MISDQQNDEKVLSILTPSKGQDNSAIKITLGKRKGVRSQHPKCRAVEQGSDPDMGHLRLGLRL
jgi:hypothetical protein